MIIAIPTNDRKIVEEHFGHCKEFAFIKIEDGKVIDTNYIVPPKHSPGVLPKFLVEQKANVIITGGMGQMAITLFKENNIDVILGAKGSVDSNLQEFIKGELASTGSACEHTHH